MRVLGVDPGLTRCGVGVVEGVAGRPLALVDVGVVRTSAGRRARRSGCSRIERGLDAWLDAHRPDVVAIERVFAQHNVQHRDGHRAGRRRSPCSPRPAAACRSRLHTPSEVKAAVTGYGPRRQGAGRRAWSPGCCGWPSRRTRPTPPTRWRWRSATSGAARRWRARPRRSPRHVARQPGGPRSRPMIAFVRGAVAAVAGDRAVIEVGGVGLRAAVRPGHAGRAAGRRARASSPPRWSCARTR